MVEGSCLQISIPKFKPYTSCETSEMSYLTSAPISSFVTNPQWPPPRLANFLWIFRYVCSKHSVKTVLFISLSPSLCSSFLPALFFQGYVYILTKIHLSVCQGTRDALERDSILSFSSFPFMQPLQISLSFTKGYSRNKLDSNSSVCFNLISLLVTIESVVLAKHPLWVRYCLAMRIQW